jgi:4-hydroxybutyryl-CoA dehydratase/vinylacetyl-CoA-Delta-isomerase
MKMEIWRNYPLGNKVDLVERLLERGVLTDDVRKITRNRQPGRCCIEGCQVPSAPVVVPLPQIGKAPEQSVLPLRKTGTAN